VEFNEYIEGAKIVFKEVEEQVAIEENAIDISCINEFISLQNKKLTNNIDNLIREHFKELTIQHATSCTELKKRNKYS